MRQRVEQAFKSRGLVADVVLALDDTESDFTLHPEDHHRLGVVSLDHLFPSAAIGVCTLKSKFAGQVVRNFIEVMPNQIRGFHADLWVVEENNEAGVGSLVMVKTQQVPQLVVLKKPSYFEMVYETPSHTSIDKICYR